MLSAEVRAFVLEQSRATTIESTELIQSLWSGYGEIVRCHLRGNSADANSNVVLKHVQWPTSAKHPRGWNSDIGHKRKVRSYEVEVAWYENYSRRCGPFARVPQCLGTRSLDSGVLLLLEDLDVQGYPARPSSCSDVEIDSCLRWLANFHATFLGVSPNRLWPIGCYWHLETRPEEWAALPEGPLKAAAAEVDRRLNSSRFQTLVHGDAKLANFCFSDDGTAVAAVDFQYVGGGSGMKDLAYFVSSCMDETQCQDREEELLEQYFAELRSALVRCDSQVDASELEEEWRELYPLAWTDFYRFLQGWSPGHWKIHSYSESVAKKVIASL